MRLYDVYKHKKNNNIIQIDSFATRMNDFGREKELMVVFRNMEKHNEYEIGSSPSSNGYGTQKEIEEEYELLVSAIELDKYNNWNEIFALIGE